MKYFTSILFICMASTVASMAQIVSLPMTLDSSGQITEQKSGSKFVVEDAHTPVNIDGVKGDALRFDGYSTYVNATIDASQLSTSTLSVSLLCAPQTFPIMNVNEAENAYTMIFGNIDDANHNGFAINLSSQGDYNFECYTGGWKVSVESSEKLKLGQWSQIVATINAANKSVSLYNNGKLVGTSRSMTSINTGSNDFYIGKSASDLSSGKFLINTFCGLIDDICIYNEIISTSDMTVADNATTPNFNLPSDYFCDNVLHPQFHGMPSSAWTNESHGMIYYNGKYHVFFQKNANGPYMARLHWGHISSENLCLWTEEPIAIAPSEAYDIKGCWSGCVICDDELSGGKPAIIYTAVDNAKATICMAVADDENLTTWSKVDNNPLINGRPQGLSDDFRDPYFFRANNTAYIIVGSSKNGVGTTTLHKYNAETKTWSNDGTTFFTGTDATTCGTFWEMPTITKMGDKWLFTVTPLNTKDGVKTLYWVGTIDSDGKFVADHTAPKTFEAGGVSKNGYGLLSPTIMPTDNGAIVLGIVPDKVSSEQNYDMGWAHNYSLPRFISLDANGNLVQSPFDGLSAMRTEDCFNKTNFQVDGETNIDGVSGRQLEVSATFVATSGDFGFNLLKTGSKACKVYYSGVTNQVIVDCTAVDRIKNDVGTYDGIYRASLDSAIKSGDNVKLTVFLDGSILDVFINDKMAFSVRVFATDENAMDVSAFSTVATNVTSLDAWCLDAANASAGVKSVIVANTPVVHAVNGSIVVDGMQKAHITVYDLSGRKLADRNVVCGDTINLSNHGMYIVSISSDNASSVTQKISL